MTDEELQDSITSVKYGMCKAFSEAGLSPSEAEEILDKYAAAKGIGLLSATKDFILPALGAGVAVGALAGAGTASLRNKIERMAEGNEDEEARKTRMKIEFYKKMINDLKLDSSATPY